MEQSCFLFLFLSSNLSSGVGEFHSNLLSSLDNLCSNSCADVMGDFCAEGAVVHEEDIKILDIVDDKLLESVGKEVLGGIVRAIADFWHFLIASEATAHSVINAWNRERLYLLVFSSFLPIFRRRGLTGSE